MRRFVYFLILISLVGVTVFAQTTASLTGTVTTDGKALPGVTVTISSPNLQGTRTAVTGDNGGYQFSALPPGDYKVIFELSGMATVTKRARLQLSQTARTDADLKLAAVAEAITVTATTPTVLETPQVAATYTAKQIETLPVARTPFAAALLSPGVSANTFSANQFVISGSPGYDNLVMVNGVVVTENVRSQAQDLYIEDAIQETTTLTGAISAEYGRFTGGVVNSITKSGGNTFSGSFRDTLTNPSWTKLTPLATQAKPVDTLNNIYEETLGGYVMRDRLWFFGAGRQAKVSDQQSTVGLTSTTNPARNRPAINYTHSDDQKRYEGKLTGQITPKHSLVAAYLKVTEAEGNNVFPPVYDTASLVQRSLPNALYSAHYNGMLTNNFLLEGQYSRRTFAFINSGSQFTDLVKGTLLLDRSNGNTRFNSPTFCGVCAPETRDNGEYLLKGNYYLNAGTLGNHNFVAGLDNFKEKRFAENHQSGSDYRIFVTTAFFDANGNIFPQFSAPSTFIRWTPILLKGTQDKQETKSAFVNDKWDLNAHLSFNVGMRYDRNDAVDANGNVASKDAAFSPRLTGIWDVHGNGRQRVQVSYNQYVSRIIGANVGDLNQSAGSPGAIDYAYNGPTINPNSNPTQTGMADALTQVWAWFASQCGGMTASGSIDATKCPSSMLFPGGARSIPGFAAVYNSRLKSPSVAEIILGYGAQIGATGFAKVDLIHRNWKNFYAGEVTTATPKANTPLGIPVDEQVIVNSSDIKRTYNGAQFQAQWHPRRWNIGMNYTWSKLRGNDEGETGPNGPVVNLPLGLYYPEFAGYTNRLPVGYLLADQRHRARGWAAYDIALGRFGDLNTSVLQSYDSGRPYPTLFSAALRTYSGAPSIPAYVGGAPSTANYYVCRDCNRFQAASSTDLALNYALPIVHSAQFFVRAVLTNLFNNHALSGTGVGATTANPGISTTVNSAGNQSANFVPFNPFTQTPVACPQSTPSAQCKALGANYQLASNFGQATSFFGYQQSRTYQFSLGARF
jgi:carboxypeptidase family protein/TonB-dependent receptor-like protein